MEEKPAAVAVQRWKVELTLSPNEASSRDKNGASIITYIGSMCSPVWHLAFVRLLLLRSRVTSTTEEVGVMMTYGGPTRDRALIEGEIEGGRGPLLMLKAMLPDFSSTSLPFGGNLMWGGGRDFARR